MFLVVKGTKGNNNYLSRVFPWRLSIPKKTNLLGGYNILLSFWRIKWGASFVDGQPLKKSSLSV
jgi:hypothetical protein